MQVRVVTLRYNEALQGFPEDALRTVTFGREVLNVSEHFFVHGNVPHLTLVLSLGDSPKYENAGSYRPRDPNAPNPEDGLTDEQKTFYHALKTWRNETAKAEGRPAYAIARNTQLAELVKAMPKTLSAIKEIDGFGAGRRFFLGVEPGETWRQLEQQCGQLHLVQQEQQHSVEREQQQRLPPSQHHVRTDRVPFRHASASRTRRRTCMPLVGQ